MNQEFLKKKYNLHTASEVEIATRRTEKRTGKKVPQNPEARIQNYLDRLERLALDPQKEQKKKMFGDEPRPRALLLLREKLMNQYVRPHKEKMAEGAARVEERAAREMGIEAHYGEQELEQRGEIAVEDLEKSLNNWISYLSDANEPYPIWFRYYTFRNILNLGDFDKDKGEFTKRSPGSIKLFPDIDRGALAYVQQMIEASKNPEILERLKKAQQATDTPEDQLITKEKATNFANLSFAKQYAEAINQAGEITPEMKQETKGKWVKYQQGTDPTVLWASLQNKGTAWCTKGFATAETQLKGGDFYVYYTYDKQEKPTIPRIAIRMQEENIGEVRGVADNEQNLEGNMVDIAEKKMNELPGADKYRKALTDMKQLTEIDKKVKANQKLTKSELIFLYEIDESIQGFGYERDPRIQEIRNTRDPKQDTPIALGCKPEQIAFRQSEINKNTKAYIGPLFKNIFQLNLEHIYTEFPKERIKRMEATIGGKAKQELIRELEKEKINISDYAKDMLESKDFTTSKKIEKVELIRLKVRNLGLENEATTDRIYQRVKELGLELCPAETGLHLRLRYKDQPMYEWLNVAMKQIADSNGYPCVFSLRRGEDGLWLDDYYWAGPDEGRWRSTSEFIFRLRKLRNLSV